MQNITEESIVEGYPVSGPPENTQSAQSAQSKHRVTFLKIDGFLNTE